MTQDEVKFAVDNHIVRYQRYYSAVCIEKYNGRYLWEDLFQELYLHFLKVKPEKFKPFYDQNRLHYLGGKILWYLHSKRGHRKNHADSETSPLNETCNIESVSFYEQKGDKENEFEPIDRFDMLIDGDQATDEIALFSVDIDTALNDLYTRDPFLFDVFTILQRPGESINSLSKRAKINRKFLTDSHKAACEFIRNHKQTANF